MDKEVVVYLYIQWTITIKKAISHQKKMKSCHCNNVKGEGESINYAKQSESVRERHTPYDFTHMFNLRKETDEHRWGGGRRDKP